MNLETARAALAARAAAWDEQRASLESRNWRPTPTRAELDAKAVTGDISMVKEWDLSPIAADARDPMFDPDTLPSPPPEIPVIFGEPTVGSLLCALPGAIVPKRYFRWTRDGAEIAGANTLRYTVTSADVGCAIGFSGTRMRMVAKAREVGPVRPARRA